MTRASRLNTATLVTQAADVLAALAPLVQQRVFSPGTAPAGDALVREEGAGPGGLPEEGAVARVLDALGPAPVDIDWLARATGLDIRSVRIALLELALADRIERHGAQLVSRKAL